jgi:hypothetical protein
MTTDNIATADNTAQIADETAPQNQSPYEQQRKDYAATQGNTEAEAGNDNGENLNKENQTQAQDEEARNQQANERTKRRRDQRRRSRDRQNVDARIKAETDAAYYRGRLEEREAAVNQQAQQQENIKPKVEDFGTYDDYVDALTDWKVDQRMNAANKKAGDQNQQKQDNQQQRTPQNQQTEPHMNEEAKKQALEFKKSGVEKFGADFDEMLEAAQRTEFAATDVMLEAIIESGVGPDIAMHLYDNPEESFRIANLSAYRQGKEIGKIAEQLKIGGGSSNQSHQNQHQQSNAQNQNISKAPAPIVPEKGSSVPSTDMSKLSTDEYISKRRKQLHG